MFHFNIIITKNMHQHQQHQQSQPQQKLDRRSAGLEELIMGCTSSTSTKGVSCLSVLLNHLHMAVVGSTSQQHMISISLLYICLDNLECLQTSASYYVTLKFSPLHPKFWSLYNVWAARPNSVHSYYINYFVCIGSKAACSHAGEVRGSLREERLYQGVRRKLHCGVP